MTGMLAKAALIGLAGLSLLGSGLAPARAGDVNIGFSIGSDEPQLVQAWGDDDYRYGPPPRWHRYDPPPPPRYEPPRRYWDGRPPRGRDMVIEGFCNPGRAMEKARWQGLRRANIERVTPRRVVVGGWRYGGYDQIVFWNRPGCPFAR
ncbi:hypothetical protein ACQ3G6_17245 [Allorhizobium undicola]|uniref:hypothetical protein n=1 Tax=Allorhizobium undicola TaxID=78527 RepID=UPI003D3274D1